MEVEGSTKVAEEYAKDGSVDLRGNPVLRSKRGGWFACYFIVVYEAFERMAYHGISANLVLYLTRKLHQGTVASVNNVTNWVGTGYLMPVLGAFIADAYLGRYWTFIISAAIYFLGMCLMTMAVSLPSLTPPPCTDQAAGAKCTPASALQLDVFFTALYVVAFGSGGTKPNVSTIGADQFDDFDPTERSYKISFFNWWFFSTFLGSLFAHIILVFIQDNVGWSVGYGIPTVGLFISVLVFLAGTPFYRHKAPQGSPLTRMARVVVAAIRKRNVSLPMSATADLHELDPDEYAKRGRFRILPTDSLRFLNRAAVDVGPRTPWMLSTVTDVEETKQMLRLIPIWMAQLIPSSIDSQVNTLFVKQGTTLDRHIGRHFQIPPASLTTFVTVTMLVSIIFYDRYFVRIVRIWTKNPRGISLLTRIGTGFVLHIVTMLVASLTESRRLRAAREHGVVESGKEVPYTIFVLLPQFMLMGVADCFTLVGKVELFYSQAPESMKSLGTSYGSTTYGIGNFLSSALVSSVSSITKRHGRKGWILNNLNASHLDYYYAFLGLLSFFNLIFFIYVSKLYVYKAEVFYQDQVEASKEDGAGHVHRQEMDARKLHDGI
ncbi:protein NRT1/ PTR FAMILY 5.2-like [Canna indica]|uniref:Protein NRT1/ PTR FAMILY 5.2-like n=1 Tax=Canna indica TaxID=4628 RepID=A0AAQ3Q1Y9_9LILI|nr:protein NRT1/ PTR FAMILY 5.2-like [Canna indica]